MLSFVDKQLANPKKLSISNCCFKIFESSEKGSAIYSSLDQPISIYYCVFEECVSDIAGGSIYLQTSSFYLSNSCASNCYVSENSNNYWGNFLYANCSCTALLVESSTHLCGVSADKSSDSTIVCNAPSEEVSNLNFSKSHSVGGSAGVCSSESTKARIRHCTICDGQTDMAFSIETNNASFQIRDCNIINLTALSVCLAPSGTSSIIFFTECYFFLTITLRPVYSGNYSFEKCKGNFELQGVEKINECNLSPSMVERCKVIHSQCNNIFTSILLKTMLIENFIN